MPTRLPPTQARAATARRRRRLCVALLGASALSLPLSGLATAAARVTARGHALAKTMTQKVSGQTAPAGRWGSVQVNVTLMKTSLTGSTHVRIRYTDLGGTYSYHTSRSQFIMSQALPMLRQEFLQAQSPKIRLISGATYTSDAFEQSLQSALLKAK